MWNRIATLIFVLVLSDLSTRAQFVASVHNKPVIDTNVLGKWPQILSPAISDDGQNSLFLEVNSLGTNEANYETLITVLHIVRNPRLKDHFGGIVHETKITGQISNPLFSHDSKRVYFLRGKDSLGILQLSSATVNYVSTVRSFKISEQGGWMGYLASNHQLTLNDYSTSKKFIIDSVSDYNFSKDGKVLLVKTEGKNESGSHQSLLWIDLPTVRTTTIWTGWNVEMYHCIFDAKCSQLAFSASSKDKNSENRSIYLYHKGAVYAQNIVNSHDLVMNNDVILDGNVLKFSRDGDKILFSTRKVDRSEKPGNTEQKRVVIWNYKDEYLQPDQEKPGFEDEILYQQYINVIHISDRKIIQLNHRGEQVIILDNFEKYLVVERIRVYELYYDSPCLFSLVSADDGASVEITRKEIDPIISPNDSFLIWIDYHSNQLFSFETASSKIRNISVPNIMIRGIAGWFEGAQQVLIYDKFDIWKVDLTGHEASVNLTGGLGRKDSVVFTVISPRYDRQIISDYRLFGINEKLLLAGFNLANKSNGFWSIAKAGSGMEPFQLFMDSCYFTGRTDGGDGPEGRTSPIQSAHGKQYIVVRQSAMDFPNLYSTTDFRSFQPISDLHPEKAFNWLTSKLISWTMEDGQTSQGVLYKPENFDPNRRYPIIMYYYVRQSNSLYAYKTPDWTIAKINIPYFVSNGYLVFMPDIYYKPGRNGASIVNAVESAARYLCQLPFVDSTKIGIEGHSFGGWETNYLVTHSHLFAAACAASGVSDQISNFNEIAGFPGAFPASYLELTAAGLPYGFGVTPSTRPDLYEANSPVLAVENVTTPLLVVGGDLDPSVPFRQSLEMFLAMRRAGKRVWLVEYKKNGHVFNGDDGKDLTIRLKQFFDYYLKGSPPPVWMTKGIPATLKGIDNGFEVDTSGAKP